MIGRPRRTYHSKKRFGWCAVGQTGGPGQLVVSYPVSTTRGPPKCPCACACARPFTPSAVAAECLCYHHPPILCLPVFLVLPLSSVFVCLCVFVITPLAPNWNRPSEGSVGGDLCDSIRKSDRVSYRNPRRISKAAEWLAGRKRAYGSHRVDVHGCMPLRARDRRWGSEHAIVGTRTPSSRPRGGHQASTRPSPAGS
jgi:hypothetical protein